MCEHVVWMHRLLKGILWKKHPESSWFKHVEHFLHKWKEWPAGWHHSFTWGSWSMQSILASFPHVFGFRASKYQCDSTTSVSGQPHDILQFEIFVHHALGMAICHTWPKHIASKWAYWWPKIDVSVQNPLSATKTLYTPGINFIELL